MSIICKESSIYITLALVAVIQGSDTSNLHPINGQESENKSRCNPRERKLLGPLIIDTEQNPSYEVQSLHVQKGGKFKPDHCVPHQEIAILIPYRDREDNLEKLLRHLHPVLQRQLLNYRIYVIEQTDQFPFNRGALLNVGMNYAEMSGSPDCFVFHDVDLLPEDDRNIYECRKGFANALSVAASKWKYKLQYPRYAGGVMAIGKDDISKFDGLANSFYGWGGEDDDLYHRLNSSGLQIHRNSPMIARYQMLKHDKAVESPSLQHVMTKSKQNQLMKEGRSTLQYKIQDVIEYPLYTLVRVQLPGPIRLVKKGIARRMKENFDNTINQAMSSLFNQKEIQKEEFYSKAFSWDRL